MKLDFDTIITVLRDRNIAERFLQLVTGRRIELQFPLHPAQLHGNPKLTPELEGWDIAGRGYAICVWSEYEENMSIINDMTLAAHRAIPLRRELHIIGIVNDPCLPRYHIAAGCDTTDQPYGVYWHCLCTSGMSGNYEYPEELTEMLDTLGGAKITPQGDLMRAIEALDARPAWIDGILSKRREIFADGLEMATGRCWAPEECAEAGAIRCLRSHILKQMELSRVSEYSECYDNDNTPTPDEEQLMEKFGVSANEARAVLEWRRI